MLAIPKSGPLARTTMAYVLAGGRGSRLMELTDKRAKPAVYFGGKIADHRLRPVERAEFRHPPHRRRDAIQGAQPDPSHAARLELLPRRTQRKLRHTAGRQRVSETQWYAGTADAVYQNIDIIESYSSGPHHHPRRRPHLQDGLRADAADARRTQADVTVGCIEVPREEASGFGVMEVDATDRIMSISWRNPKTRPACRTNPDKALASMGIYVFDTQFLIRPASTRCRRSQLLARFRQGHHPVSRETRQGAWRTISPNPACAPAQKQEAYWRDVGTVDAYWRPIST